MAKLRRILIIILLAALLSSSVMSCSPVASENTGTPGEYASFREIPGVTQTEIAAVEELQRLKTSFSYGMTLSTEAFFDIDGNINGFSAFISDWLTNLFDIPFIPAIYEWSDLLEGLESGAIDFTGEVRDNQRHIDDTKMTDAIAERQLIVVRLNDSATIQDIEGVPRFIFLDGTTSASLVADHQDDFDSFFVDDFSEAYEMLKNGEADAFIAEVSARAAFSHYEEVEISPFYPIVFAAVSLSTRNPELTPIISVVQKALDDSSIRHLVKLYNQGHQEYLKYRFFSLLSDNEREYIKNNPVIPVAAEVNNYPVSFYNSREGDWQGIAIDVLRELELLTGMEFSIVTGPAEEWPDLLAALESGRAAMITELLYSEGRAGRFLWPENELFTDLYALISKTEHYKISINEIHYLNIGLVRGTAHAALFHNWFPNHRNTIEYENNNAAIEALQRGEIDMLMSTQHRLLHVTNFLEQAGYKINFIFPTTYQSTFGINTNYTTLRDVVDKGLGMIDTETIAGHWMRRTFDYRVKLEQQRTVWLIGGTAVFLVLVFLFALFLRKRSEGRRLEDLVHNRTEALEEATAAAETASRSKSSFLASMSHEIRTPMNAIIGMLELLTHEPLNEQQMSYVKDISRSATSLLTIINDILDMSKIESGKMELVPVDYNFLAFIDHMHSMFTYVAEEKGLEFKFEVDSTAPNYLFGDDIRLRQIIINICGNAVKFTERGYVRLKVINSGDTLIFEISDTGRGIKQEDIGKLFSAFQQTDSVKNRGITGTGLGLAICKSFAEMMGGAITVESEYGVGTTFTVTIPLVEGDGDKVKAAAIPKGRKAYAPKAKILVVDDNEFNLRVADGLLKLSQIKAQTADSGALSIEMVQQTDYHIVFMDHMMPEMDGVEATAAIRALGGKFEHLPIVALTANAVQGAREFFLENSFDDFLSKPIDVRELTAILEKWLPEDVLEKAPKEPAESAKSESGGTGALDILGGIDFINVTIGMSNVGDIEDLYLGTVESCCKLFPTECAQMSASLADGDLGRFAITVHAVKSVLATIGAVDLSDVALKLEMAAKRGDAVVCEDLYPEFCDNLTALTKGLLDVFPGEACGTETASKTPGDEAALKEGVEKALAAAREYDTDAGIAAIEPLLAFSFGKDTDSMLEAAIKELREFDCEKAAEILVLRF